MAAGHYQAPPRGANHRRRPGRPALSSRLRLAPPDPAGPRRRRRRGRGLRPRGGPHPGVDLDFNEPRLLWASTPALSITRDWAHLSDPVVLLAAPDADLVALASPVLRGFPADRLVVVFQGPARALAPVRAWLPPVQHVSGPACFDPVPLALLRLPPRFAGEACLGAELPCGDEVSGDLNLWLGATPRLNLGIRSGLTPAQKRRLEAALAVKLTFEGAD